MPRKLGTILMIAALGLGACSEESVRKDAAEEKTAFQVIPQYGIRGSISQLDESVGKKTEGGGISVEGFIGVGKASTASTNVLGLDLTVMRTEDLSIVPGVTASNSVMILR